MAVSTPDPMEAALKKQVKNPYDLRREQAQADTSEETDRQRDALRAQLTGQGIYDSGIRTANERDLDTRQAKALAQRQGAIDVEQGQAAERKTENDANRALTSRGLDIQEKGVNQSGALGSRGLDIQEKGVNQAGALGARGLDIQEKGVTQAGELGWAGLNQGKELALAGMGIQKASLALQEKGMSQQDAQFYAGLGQAKALAEKGFSIQEIGLELQKMGIENQASQFLASMAHDTSENNLNRTAAKDLQTGEHDFQSGENKLNRTAAVDLVNLNQTHAVELANLNSSLQKDYATFQDAINDINTAGDQKSKVELLYLSEKIAALDPKNANFQQQLYDTINGAGTGADLGDRPDSQGPQVTTGAGSATLPAGSAAPPENKWNKSTLPYNPKGDYRNVAPVITYWNPDTGKYESAKNAKYTQFYG